MFPLKYNDIGAVKLPRLKYKRGAKLTKNPYKVKKIPMVDESKLPKRVLDGYAIIDSAKCEYPSDIIKINLSSEHSHSFTLTWFTTAEKNIVKTKQEDFGWFVYLIELDVSENFLDLESLVYLSAL